MNLELKAAKAQADQATSQAEAARAQVEKEMKRRQTAEIACERTRNAALVLADKEKLRLVEFTGMRQQLNEALAQLTHLSQEAEGAGGRRWQQGDGAIGR